MSETKGKKLIEVALPLDKINEACVREKSIRHGHPSTLHLWWARRPLAAARAVIWASLVDDPSSHPEQFPTETAQEKERNRLFKILEKLVVWENSCDEQVLHAAKEEIMKSTGGNPPALLDPFCGGGAIPLEAQRLGLKAYASDLNPIPVMINKAMIEIPPLFQDQKPVHPGSSQLNVYQGNAGLAEDVEYYANWMRDEAYKRIGYLYPKATIRNGGGEKKATVIAWIWARTVKCPNPACQSEIPLVHSFNLSKKKGHECHIHLDIDHSTHPASITYTIESGLVEGTKEGTVSRQGAVCPVCGEPIDFPYLREEGKRHHLGATLMAIVADGPNGRIYLPATEEHVHASECERPENAPDGHLSGKALVNIGLYGFSSTKDLFTPRQLVALTTFSALVQEAQQKAEQDALAAGRGDDGISLEKLGKGAKAYGQAIGVYLAFIVDKLADYQSTICVWHTTREILANGFRRQAIPMTWDYAEGNPFSGVSGSWHSMSQWVSQTIDNLSLNNCSLGSVVQWDATQDISLRNIMVSTDPPYYDNIAYADLSDFFYVWMRQSLQTTYPDLFATMLTPKTPELIASPYRFDGSKVKAKQHFEDGMLQTCRNIFQYARPDIPVTIYYAFKQSDSQETDGTASSGWETMLSAIIKAGFVITGTWPLRTELTTALKGQMSALSSSIVIVCRKPDGARPDILRKDFVDILHGELKDALTKLQSSNIAPVDLAQSIIGPGIAVYSRYRKVLAADGSAISVRDALKMINAAYAEIIKVTSFGPEADFCLILYEQNGFNDMRFGEADVLARSKNTAVDKMAKEGLVDSAKGTVRLKTREELSAFSPHSENLWLITQQVVQACEKNGYEGTAAIFSQLNGAQTDQVKKMCYRLYKIADSKGWSKDGQAYNAVIAGWDAMAHEAAQLKQQKNQAVQGTLGF